MSRTIFIAASNLHPVKGKTQYIGTTVNSEQYKVNAADRLLMKF